MEELINKCYEKLKKYFFRVEKDNFVVHFRDKMDFTDIQIFEKLNAIYLYLKFNIKEKKKYFLHSKYEIVGIDKNIEQLYEVQKFDQKNFKDLINKCKILIESERENLKYIETLKNRILQIESEKVLIIEKTKKIIDDLKCDNLSLIDSLEKSNLEKEKLEKEKNELTKKSEDIYKKSQQIYILKGELEKNQKSLGREVTKISSTKDKEISILKDKLKFFQKFQEESKKLEIEITENKKTINQLKLKLQKCSTENSKYICEIRQIQDDRNYYAERVTKLENLYRESKSTINMFVKKEYKDFKYNILKSADDT